MYMYKTKLILQKCTTTLVLGIFWGIPKTIQTIQTTKEVNLTLEAISKNKG